MKKLYILAFSLFALNLGFAQCNIDETTTDYGLSPDNLTSGCVDSEVNRSLTITLPNKYDIVYLGQPITVTGDKVTLQSVENLPTGMDYECKDVNCEMQLPNTINRSCIGINGTPTAEYNSEIKITLRIQVSIAGNSSVVDSVYNIPIQIHAANSPECLELSNDFFEVEEESFTVAPNPINAASSLNINLNQASKASIEVFDILGKETVSLFNGSLDAGYQEIPLNKLKDNLDSGIYLVKIFLEDSNETIIKKVYID